MTPETVPSCGAPCPTCRAPFRKLYTFGVGKYCGGGCAEVVTYRGCPHATVTRYDPCGVLEPARKACPTYGEAAGVARFHVMEMRAKGLA
jgi:hypothetical protein